MRSIRHHLLAEDVELFQYGLQRQARVVHDVHLPLVVAEVLPEGECPVDDLLGTADRQRRRHGAGLW
ncbi:hypothetical protein GCM10029978_065260 [Actinoallomurus acanthiterrae]